MVVERISLDTMVSQSNNRLDKYPDIVTPVYEYKRSKIRNYPQHKNRASECGHPCIRYLVFCRTRWEDRLLHKPELEFIFDGGMMIEDMAIRELQEAGIKIIEQQRSFEWKALELTGRLDAKVLIDGVAYPLEIKGLNHYDFEKLNTIEDFHRSSKVWVRGYPAQLMMYMLNTNSELGCFYLKDKLTFQPKQIWVELDYDYAEGICKKLELVNKHVKEGTLPEGVDDYDICHMCSFVHICLPEIKQKALEFVEDPDFEEKLLRREELTQYVKEYNALDKDIKNQLEGKDKIMVGDFMISGSWVERKGYFVEDGKYWRVKITRLSPQVEGIDQGL